MKVETLSPENYVHKNISGGIITISKFEDIEAWQNARDLTKGIYEFCNEGRASKDFGYRDQVQRAAISVTSNIAEGFELNNNKEFVRYLKYSKGSCGEIRSLLIVASDLQYINEKKYVELSALSIKISSQIANFIKYLQSSNKNKN